MIYIRKIFRQDLRDGKQIAFPKEPSNFFFNFSFNPADSDKQINFKFIEDDSASPNYSFNGNVINTRLYAAGSESRIDGQLKHFFKDSLNAQIDDIIVFSKKRSDTSFTFRYIQQASTDYSFFHTLLNNSNHEVSLIEDNVIEDSSDIKTINKIFYGAPGTGKSFKVNEIVSTRKSRTVRITFHPEFDYASFLGGYKPTMIEENGQEIIKYKFVPQAFTDIYVKAWNDQENDYYLVIEEINRGNCAEIFGDIFQLLDRDSDYDISPSIELEAYLKSVLTDENKGLINGKLKLPNNLTIFATMNTSDQSLFPMDSAFKRRWDWEYIPICYEELTDEDKPNPSFNYIVDLGDGASFKWNEFISKVNLEHIQQNPVLGMDKCMGNYFVKPKNGESTVNVETFINKAVFYLWNDVFKDEKNEVFEENSSYEDFFPIKTKGVQKLTELLERIEVTVNTTLEN